MQSEKRSRRRGPEADFAVSSGRRDGYDGGAMRRLPKALETLLNELGRLPGVGRRGAERMAVHLLEAPPGRARALAEAIADLRDKVTACARCGNWSEDELCPVCADPHRDTRVLCVVERPGDLWAFEQSESFAGLYHVLGGTLSPMNGVTAGDLTIAALQRRVREEGIEEVILATNPSVDGDATAHYLGQLLAPTGVRLSRIAQGVPQGGHLDYADAGTLRLALEGRRRLDEG
jgi:recombination protein RecR